MKKLVCLCLVLSLFLVSMASAEVIYFKQGTVNFSSGTEQTLKQLQVAEEALTYGKRTKLLIILDAYVNSSEYTADSSPVKLGMARTEKVKGFLSSNFLSYRIMPEFILRTIYTDDPGKRVEVTMLMPSDIENIYPYLEEMHIEEVICSKLWRTGLWK